MLWRDYWPWLRYYIVRHIVLPIVIVSCVLLAALVYGSVYLTIAQYGYFLEQSPNLNVGVTITFIILVIGLAIYASQSIERLIARGMGMYCDVCKTTYDWNQYSAKTRRNHCPVCEDNAWRDRKQTEPVLAAIVVEGESDDLTNPYAAPRAYTQAKTSSDKEELHHPARLVVNEPLNPISIAGALLLSIFGPWIMLVVIWQEGMSWFVRTPRNLPSWMEEAYRTSLRSQHQSRLVVILIVAAVTIGVLLTAQPTLDRFDTLFTCYLIVAVTCWLTLAGLQFQQTGWSPNQSAQLSGMPLTSRGPGQLVTFSSARKRNETLRFKFRVSPGDSLVVEIYERDRLTPLSMCDIAADEQGDGEAEIALDSTELTACELPDLRIAIYSHNGLPWMGGIVR